MKTPVVMFVFNRPDLTRRSLAAIGRARPEQLFVVADGPRLGNPDDARLCREVRELFSDLDWPCKVQRRFAETNRGLDPNIEAGIDWVFSQVDRADLHRGRLHRRSDLLRVSARTSSSAIATTHRYG